LAQAARSNAPPAIVYVQLDTALAAIDHEKKRAASLGIKPLENNYLFKSVWNTVPGVVAVSAVQQQTKIARCNRYQLPLVLAHATTVHKAQGQTCPFGVVFRPPDLSKVFERTMGLCYVGCSRAVQLAGPTGLVLLGRVTKEHFMSGNDQRSGIGQEYARLRLLPLSQQFTHSNEYLCMVPSIVHNSTAIIASSDTTTPETNQPVTDPDANSFTQHHH
jgi:hypothetical protein